MLDVLSSLVYSTLTRFGFGPEPNYQSVKEYFPGSKPDFICIAGPCSIESPRQIETIARAIKTKKISFMRGGVFRAGTYPPRDSNFGLQQDLLEHWHRISKRHGLKIIVEVLDIREIDLLNHYADAFQVGARHMQDYALLKELAYCRKTVALKRHPGCNLNEFLGAAEYLVKGKCQPILIERGSSTFMDHVRWDLSVSLIAAIKRITGIPVIVDASHGSGRRDLIEPLTLAGIAAGADGFLVETHPKPNVSLSDPQQAYPLKCFGALFDRANAIWKLKRKFK